MNLSQLDWSNKLQSDQNAIIIDVRTLEEWKTGTIPNAIKIDVMLTNNFVSQIDSLNKDKNYYVYCRAGSRSENACNIMNQMGFKNTYNLVGGITQWKGEIEI